VGAVKNKAEGGNRRRMVRDSGTRVDHSSPKSSAARRPIDGQDTFSHTCYMDPRDDELLIHLAAGTDLPTALAATSGDEPPPNTGCLTIVVMAVAVIWAALG
jgi:hypothetical protein